MERHIIELEIELYLNLIRCSINVVEGHLWKPSRQESPIMRVTRN